MPEGTHTHDKFIKPSELIKMIDATDLIERGITGLSYNPLTDTYKLGKRVDVNYIVFTEKAI
ncbi:3-demethylubiquinone-9 3-methyltransferase [Vibrio maritimus]|uniref:3-demethylubiquinone-9 3-methyltransferase n=1 Tax=Vibrio maritimus TaxID=990268 RepID=A0A090RVV5_9VIBR|nr:3-demethylubiquinone-9 3-methyltransferase [Vibrio maritimus]